MTVRNHAAIAAMSLLLALSPVGAPALGALMVSACPVDTTIVPDWPFAMPFHYCGFSRAAEHQYQKAMFWPVLAIAKAGGVVGPVIALAWVLAAIALPFAFFWNVARAVRAWRKVED